jgi:tetratricopeptide (TPR) repeat protein
MLARDLCYVGRFDEAEPLLQEARAVDSAPAERTLISAVEALLLTKADRLGQAEAAASAAVAIAEAETDNVWLQGWSNEDLALVLERAGRIDEAREALERALAVWEGKGCLPCADRVRDRIHSLGRAQV